MLMNSHVRSVSYIKIDSEYNILQLRRISQLLSQKRRNYIVDMHIHTSYSSDGIQTVVQALHKAKEKKIDIISFTDHDTISAYEEIIDQKLYEDETLPIIIPGVEFTVSYPEYERRCHVLKYFFDINDSYFRNNLHQNETAFKRRVTVWFQRIRENSTLQYFIQKHDISCTEKAYFDFLNDNPNKSPEYATLMEYLYSLLSEKGVFVWDVYNKAVEMNEMDICLPRKNKMRSALQRFYEKYKEQDIFNNYRKLRPILAPIGVDDSDYPNFLSSGSLSIGEYGQTSVLSLNNSGINILAHPDQDRLFCIDSLTDVFQGLELNYRSDEATNKAVYEKVCSKSLCLTKGSDKHNDTNEFYENMDFYKMTYSELQLFSMCARKSLFNPKNLSPYKLS